MAQKLQPQAEILSGSPQPNFTGYNAKAVIAKRAPTTGDTGYPIGQQWVDKVAQNIYFLAAVSAGTATWSLASAAAGFVATVNGLAPVAGDILIAGTANQITQTSAGHTVTASLPAAIVAPGSLTTTTSLASTTTLTAGTSLTVTAGDATVTLGHVIINGAGKQLRVHGGAVTDFIGETTLALGTVTVLNTNIAATDRILISRRSINGSTALGLLTYSITPATSFTITSVQAATPAVTEVNDVSILEYVIVRQV